MISFWIITLSSHASSKVRNSRVNRRPIWIMCKKLSKMELACLSCWEFSKLRPCHWLELQIGGWRVGCYLPLSNFSCKKLGFAIFGLLGALKAQTPSLIGSSNFGRGRVCESEVLHKCFDLPHVITTCKKTGDGELDHEMFWTMEVLLT